MRLEAITYAVYRGGIAIFASLVLSKCKFISESYLITKKMDH